MVVKELDAVKTNSGVLATILLVKDPGVCYLAESATDPGDPNTYYEFTLMHEDIKEVVYRP